MDIADLTRLVNELKGGRPAPQILSRLDELADLAPLHTVTGKAPDAAGGRLGDIVATRVPYDNGQVQVMRYLKELGVTVRQSSLSDPFLRAVTLLHQDGRAVIVLNAAYERGTQPHVVRFTLAHELGHLIYDRVHAKRLAIASGAWAPVNVEQRANGFAAGLLMPEFLLRRELDRERPEVDPHALRRMAHRLGVGVHALTDRLANTRLLSREAADHALDALLEEATG